MDEQITPILRTQDPEAALAWYAPRGFALDWEHRCEPGAPLFASISRGLLRIFLSERRAQPPR